MRLFERLPWTLLAVATLSLSVACGDENGNGSNGNGNGNGTGNGGTDAGAVDGGNGNVDAGGGDAGPVVCNPVDGSGCPNAGQRCVLAIENGGTSTDQSCRSTSLELVGLEEECDLTGQNCEAGLVCTNFQGDPNPTCRKVCTAGSGSECTNLQGGFDSYTCNEFDDRYGVCIGFAGCDPIDQMSCPTGETCGLVNGATGETGCVQAGPAGAGASCESRACMRGLICLNLGEGGVCWEACDDTNPDSCSDSMSQLCQGLQDPIEFGVCTDRPEACDPADAVACPANQTCTIVAGDGSTGCRPAGGAAVGESCSDQNCVRGAICIDLGDGPICWTGCDPDDPSCPGAATCQSLEVGGEPLPFGVCEQ
jgi:hypothetical protein